MRYNLFHLNAFKEILVPKLIIRNGGKTTLRSLLSRERATSEQLKATVILLISRPSLFIITQMSLNLILVQIALQNRPWLS